MAESNPPKEPNFFGPAYYVWNNIFPQDKVLNSSKTPNPLPTSDLDNIIDKLKVENDPYETLLMLEILGKQLNGEIKGRKIITDDEDLILQSHKNYTEIQNQLIYLKPEEILQKVNDTSSAIESRYNLFFQHEQKDYAFENFKKNYEKSYRVLEKSFAEDAKPEDPKSLSKKKFFSLVNKYATDSDFSDPQRNNSGDKLTEFAFSLTVSHLLGRQKQTQEDGEARQEAENKKSIPNASYWNPDFTVEEKKSIPSASYWNSDFTLTSIDSNFRSLASTSIAFFTPFVSSINKIFPTPDSQTQFQQNNATPAVQKSNELNTDSSFLSQASTNTAVSSQNLKQAPTSSPSSVYYSLNLKFANSAISSISNFFQSLIPQSQQNKESPAPQKNELKEEYREIKPDQETIKALQKPLNNFLTEIRKAPPKNHQQTPPIPRGWLKGIENGEVAIFAVKNNNATPQKPLEKNKNTKEGKKNISPTPPKKILSRIKTLKKEPLKQQKLGKGQQPPRSNYR